MNGIANALPIDLKSIAMGAAGYAAGFYGISWYSALLAAAAFETIQDGLDEAPGVEIPESRANVLLDLIVFMSGYAVAERARR